MDNLITIEKYSPQSKEEFAYETIREAILSGDLLPNTQISLSGLAKELGVSIIPVNHAIRRLISEGLVRQDPHHSPYVEDFSPEAVEDILSVRNYLEELAMKESIPNINANDMLELRKLKAELDETIEKNDMHAYGIWNRKFHMKIYSFCPNQLLYDLIDDLWNKAELNRSRSVFVLVKDMASHSQKDHETLLNLIDAKKVDEAICFLNKHRAYSRKKLLEISK